MIPDGCCSMRREIAPAFVSAALLLLHTIPATGQTPTAPADPEQRQVRALAATCAACHGFGGRPAAGSLIPPLAGLTREQFTERMLEYRQGSLPATVMHQISKGYEPAQIDALAAWFAAQPR